MATINNSGFITLTATAVALVKYMAVKVDSAGLMEVSGIGDPSIGTVQHDVAASGSGVVKLWTAQGTHLVIVGTPTAAGARLLALADGEFDDSATGNTQLVALEAGAADQDVIPVAMTATDAIV